MIKEKESIEAKYIFDKLQTLTDGIYALIRDLSVGEVGLTLTPVLMGWCERNNIDTLEFIEAIKSFIVTEFTDTQESNTDQTDEKPTTNILKEIRNSNGSLLFTSIRKDNYWIIEVKRRNKLTRVRLFDDGDMFVQNFNIDEGSLELECSNKKQK